MEMKERIKKVRTDAGLSLRAFGERIGINNGSSVMRLESGENNPSEQTLRLISTVFRVNYDWLAEGNGEPYLPATDDDLIEEVMDGSNEFAKKAFRVFARLSDAEWQLIRRIVNELKEED